jgi:uncharacterized protein YkwD
VRRPRPGLLLLVLVCAVALSVIRAAPAQAGTTRAEAKLLRVMNHARTARGLARVHLGSTIQTSSHSWARYLLVHDAFYHYGRLPAGTSENIGWLTCRRGWATTLVRMWLNSSAHRVNLLDRSARRVGVGVAGGSYARYSCARMAVTRFR